MICDYCGNASAGKYLRVIFGGKARHYCPQCALQFQRGDALAMQMTFLNVSDEKSGYDAEKTCPECGMRFETLQKSGSLGCSGCYQAFRGELAYLMTRINGTACHVEEVREEPEELNETEKQLFSLQGELAQAVSMENYERAAELRDEIKALTASGFGGNAS